MSDTLKSRPIIIISMPRSGSSMTAGIFHKHGVWVGPYHKGDKTNAKGHFEGLPIKDLIKRRVGAIVNKGILAEQHRGFKHELLRILEEHNYSNPWLFKCSAMYYPLFLDFEPHFICVRRDVNSIIASGKKTKFFVNEDAVQPHIDAMDAVVKHHNGVSVYTDEIIKGDYSSLQWALESCGLQMDKAIVDEFVDPSLWHYRSS